MGLLSKVRSTESIAELGHLCARPVVSSERVINIERIDSCANNCILSQGLPLDVARLHSWRRGVVIAPNLSRLDSRRSVPLDWARGDMNPITYK